MAYTERYVTTTGAGAHDGTSEANAWSLAEAIAAVGTGLRRNVKVGTYILSADVTLPDGAGESSNEWRGYSATIGDLDLGRATPTGELDVTDYPIIDGGSSYAVTMGLYNSLLNLHIRSGKNAGVVTPTTGYSIRRCRVENTNTTGAAAGTIENTATYGAIVDCDLVIASNHSSIKSVNASRGTVVGCRVWHSATPASGATGIDLSGVGATAFGNLIFNMGVGIVPGSSCPAIVRNTIYNCTNGISLGGAGTIVADNVIYLMAARAFLGQSNSGNPILLRNACGALTSGRIDTAGMGSVIEETDPIVLTADPFVDAAGGDFRLNTAAGGGALCRAASSFFGGFADLGAVQHQDAGGGGGSRAVIL